MSSGVAVKATSIHHIPGCHPLDAQNREIRLVTLLPKQTSKDFVSKWRDSIFCKMSYVSLNADPKYYAFSHTWIPRKRNTKKIVVDGVEIYITETLFDFLQSVRAHPWPTKTFSFWLDIICVNQADVRERSHQVSMMRDIYQRAVATISWLGPCNGDVQHFCRGIRAARDRAYSEYYSDYDYFEFYSRKLWSGFRNLIERPYWGRVWILQEIALAKEVYLLCGSEVVVWSDMDRFVGVMQTWEKRRGYRLKGFDTWLSLDELRKIGPLTKIWLLLDMFNTANCEDPRDHVYGLLPMAEQTARDEVTVDYTMSAQQVFDSIARYCRKMQPLFTPGHDLETTLNTLAVNMGLREQEQLPLSITPSRARRFWRWTARRTSKKHRGMTETNSPMSTSEMQSPINETSCSKAASNIRLEQFNCSSTYRDTLEVHSSYSALTSMATKSTRSWLPSSTELRKPLVVEL